MSGRMSLRIAAVGDIHVGTAGTDLVELWTDLDAHADLLLLAGDLTRCGTTDEARVVAAAVARVPVSVVAVLGNHDVHTGNGPTVVAALEEAGATVLEGSGCTVQVAGTRVGVAGGGTSVAVALAVGSGVGVCTLSTAISVC